MKKQINENITRKFFAFLELTIEVVNEIQE